MKRIRIKYITLISVMLLNGCVNEGRPHINHTAATAYTEILEETATTIHSTTSSKTSTTTIQQPTTNQATTSTTAYWNTSTTLTSKQKTLKISSESFETEYNGYKFKISGLDDESRKSIILDVLKPDGEMAQVKVSDDRPTEFMGLKIMLVKGSVKVDKQVSAELYIWRFVF